MNWKLLHKVIGSLLFLEALFMAICLGVAILYDEDDIFAFTLSLLTTVMSGFILRYYGKDAANSLKRKDSFVVVSAAWCAFSLFGTLPFLIGGYTTNFTDAYFEAMSGFTTTGATIFSNVESLPHGIIFWRSLSQWIGALGIVFFTIAIIPSMGGGSVMVFSAEATGPIKTKLHPRLSRTAQSIWTIFTILSIACAVSFKFLGMGWFDAVNYSMTSLATGGFSPHNDSLMHFHSAAIEYVATLFCFLSGINFILLYKTVVKGQIVNSFRNQELRFYTFTTLFFTAFVTMELIVRNGYDFATAFRNSIFHVVSFMTTTGVASEDAVNWPHTAWGILAICMFMGGCAGSTAGGFKSVRCVMLLKIVKNEFKQMLHPRAVLPLRIGETNVTTQRQVTLLAFFTAYVILGIICIFSMIAAGIDTTNALTITISTLSNVGPSLSTTVGPAISWESLPIMAKWLCSLLMLMGRLEIFSVLIIFTPTFWKEQ